LPAGSVTKQQAPVQRLDAAQRVCEGPKAVSWFFPPAQDAIAKVRGPAALLESKGIPVNMMTTTHPGTILYSDTWQVAAKPRKRAAFE
jgi:hypothetical protein